MKKFNTFFSLLLLTLSLSYVLFSCKKDKDTFPDSDEAISFQGIDSTTIEMRAGEELSLDVVLITDTIIDSLKIGYLIDTLGITTNLTYSDIETKVIHTGFAEVNNKHVYAAKIKLPANAYGIRAFRPFTNNVGDYVRIIFRMEAGSRSYEKQVKVIIEP
jgi:hypothetical protein